MAASRAAEASPRSGSSWRLTAGSYHGVGDRWMESPALGPSPPIGLSPWFAYIAPSSMISPIKPVVGPVRAAHPLLNSAVMNKLLTLALAVPLVACVVGSGTDTTDPGQEPGGGSGPGPGPGTGTDHITSNTTWSGPQSVDKALTVDPNVTLTISAGTTVKFGTAGAITVKGTVDIQGTKAEVVTLAPSAAGGFYPGFVVSLGGALKMNYVVQTGAENLIDGGTFTVTNTRMSNASHDLLVVNSGTVDMSYSAIGLEPGMGTDTTHCDMHFGGSGTTIKVTHSNISTSAYGLMLYGGNNVDLTLNNWFSNPIQIDTSAGVSGNITGGWFDKGAPTAGTGATLTYDYQNPVMTRLPATMTGPQ